MMKTQIPEAEDYYVKIKASELNEMRSLMYELVDSTSTSRRELKLLMVLVFVYGLSVGTDIMLALLK